MNGPGSSCAALNDAKESKIETTTVVVLLNRKLVSIQFKPLLCTCDDTLIAICCSWLCYYYYIFVTHWSSGLVWGRQPARDQ